MNTYNWQHWSIEQDAQKIAWLTLNRQDSNVNSLSAQVMEEFSQVLDVLDKQRPAGLIVRTGKNNGFIVGADINEFSQLGQQDKAIAILNRGWRLFNRLSIVPYPTLALIKGHCLGGGLEFILACRYRVVVDEPNTYLGLPEVMLGIFPGWGGIYRLPKLVGIQTALDMMLTGRRIDPSRALRIGLVDAKAPIRVCDGVARQILLSGRAPARAKGIKAWMARWPLKKLVQHMALKEIVKKDPMAHYPAPRAIVSLWTKYDGDALKAPELVNRILSSTTATNLLRVFHLQERLKSFGKQDGVKPVKYVHVVGAGVMGGDIAIWCALQGIRVTLQDQTLERIAPVVARANQLFKRKLKNHLLIQAALDRLIPDPLGYGASLADIVIEAISENIEAKHSLYSHLETQMRPDALLATNTSSLSLEELRSALKQPDRLIGIHFFNPVSRMPLVEVVSTKDGSQHHQKLALKACAFVAQLGKLPLPVKSAPGFLVNAALGPYMLAALQQVDKGVSPEIIDTAITRFGMPMGPIELADTVGLDVVLAVGEALSDVSTPPDCLQKLITQGHLGRKTGRGFYLWNKGHARKKSSNSKIPDGLVKKLVQYLVNNAQKQLDQGVVADADLVDAGMIFGTGYAPFTGGPLHQHKLIKEEDYKT